MTDNDHGLFAAIGMIEYRESIQHLLCTFHIFEMNVKRRICAFLSRSGDRSKWNEFRKEISICREAATEDDLNKLWKDLINKWLPESDNTARARNYMFGEIWNKRKYWAVCYFPSAFTLGASSTQRAESWNSVMKSSADRSSMKSLLRSLEMLTNRQGSRERSSWSRDELDESFMSLKRLVGKKIASQLSKNRVSIYALGLLYEEICSALRMVVDDLTSGTLVSDENRFHVSAVTQNAYPESVSGDCRTRLSLVWADETKQSIRAVKCECRYQERVKIPCRHSLALAMHLDRLAVTVGSGVSPIAAFHLERLLECISSRWCQNMCKDDVTTRSFLASSDSPRENLNAHYIQDFDGFSAYKRNYRRRVRDQRKRSKESLLADALNESLTFSYLMGQFKRFAEPSTSNKRRLCIGKAMIQLMLELENEIIRDPNFCNSASQDEETLHALARSHFQSAISKIGMRIDLNSEEKLLNSSLSSSASSARSRRAGHEGNDADIQDPEPRNNRTQGKANKNLIGKRRSFRDMRRKKSLRVPATARETSLRKPSINITRVIDKNDREPTKKTNNLHVDEKRDQMEISVSAVPVTNQSTSKPEYSMDSNVDSISDIIASPPPLLSDSDQIFEDLSSRRLRSNIPEKETENNITGSRDLKLVNETYSGRGCIHAKWHESVTVNAVAQDLISDLSLMDLIEFLDPSGYNWKRGHVTALGTSPPYDGDATVEQIGSRDLLEVNLRVTRWRKVLLGHGSRFMKWNVEPHERRILLESLHQAQRFSSTGKEMIFLEATKRCKVTACDILTLNDGKWLSEAVIESFTKILLRQLKHPDDLRFMYLSTHAIVHGRESKKYVHGSNPLRRWLNGIQLHDIDVIIWPVHFQSHWLLCLIYPGKRRSVLFDPYQPRDARVSGKELRTIILYTLQELSSSYDAAYERTDKWTLRADPGTATTLNFPAQPLSNSCDCGVFICVYIACILSGKAYPFKSRCRRSECADGSYEDVISNVRQAIGFTIISKSSQLA